jgi:hypothetical protein
MNQPQHLDKSYVTQAGHYGYRVQQQLSPPPLQQHTRNQRSEQASWRKAVTFQDKQYNSVQQQQLQQRMHAHHLYSTTQANNLDTFGNSRQQPLPRTSVRYFV